MSSTSWSSKCEVVHLSLDINELVRLVKRAAVEAVQAGAPMSGGYGYVTSTSPLEITVDQKKILTEAQYDQWLGISQKPGPKPEKKPEPKA